MFFLWKVNGDKAIAIHHSCHFVSKITMANNPWMAGNSDETHVASLMLVCHLFIVHIFTNSLLLSAWNTSRCLFWKLDEFSDDEAWMANWFSYGHFHVSCLLACIAFVSFGNPKQEVTLSYIVAGIIFVYLAEGIFSIDLLSGPYAYLQTGMFLFILGGIAFLTSEIEKGRPMIPLPSKLTSTSFDRRKKISVASVAVGAQFVSAVFRVVDMVFGEGRDGYLGDTSSPVYKNMSSLSLCDMMIAAVLLAAALRFYDPDQLKIVLFGQVAALLVSLAMLAGSQGEMIAPEQVRAGGIGTFVSILVALVGAL